MRVEILLSCALIASSAATAAADGTSVWNTKVTSESGETTKLTVFGEHPTKLFAACRCVAGTWKVERSGESSNYFAGALQSPFFNHPRAKTKKTMTVKVRKTRELMGAPRAHRAPLLGIMRGSGQLVLREVTGGEWEVVGYSPEPVGDLFTSYPNWRTQKAKPARPTPFVDPESDALALAKVINDYRASLGLPRVPISRALTKVAQAHAHDLNVNKPVTDRCNMHSWSDKGSWSSCCYDKSSTAARCMWVKPKEIAGYRGKGYEIAAFASGVTPERALELWQQSEAHHAVMTNKGIWKSPWRAMGVAIEGDYGVAWFGEEPDKN